MKNIADYVRTGAMYLMMTAAAFGADPVKVNRIADYLRPTPTNGSYRDIATGKEYPSSNTKVSSPSDTQGRIFEATFMLAKINGLERLVVTTPALNENSGSVSFIRIETNSLQDGKYGSEISSVYIQDFRGGPVTQIKRGDQVFKIAEDIFNLIVNRKDEELTRQNPSQPDKK